MNVNSNQLESLVFDNLLQALYASLSHRKAFQFFIAELTEQVLFCHAGLIVIDTRSGKALYGWGQGYPPGLIELQLKTGLIYKDEQVKKALTLVGRNVHSIADCNTDFELSDMKLSTFSRAWATAAGLKDSACMRFELGDGLVAALVMNRHKKVGVCTLEDLGLLSRLHSHIERALSLYHSLVNQKALNDSLRQLMLNAPRAMAVYSQGSYLQSCNRAFVELGERYQCYQVSQSNTQLTLLDAEYDIQLNNLLLSFEYNCDEAESSLFMPVNNGACFVVLKFTLTAVLNAECELDYILMQVEEPKNGVALSFSDVQKIIKCSEAEAAVCVDLAAGFEVKGIAKRQNLSEHTIRSYIKSVLEKNQLKRQAELVSLLLRVAHL